MRSMAHPLKKCSGFGQTWHWQFHTAISGRSASWNFRPIQYDGVIKLALIDELVNEIIPPLAHGAVAPMTLSVCMGFCFRIAENADFLVAQADEDVSVSQHHFGEGWFAIVQFKACRE